METKGEGKKEEEKRIGKEGKMDRKKDEGKGNDQGLFWGGGT